MSESSKRRISITIDDTVLTQVDDLVRRRRISELEGRKALATSRSSLVEALLRKQLVADCNTM